MQKIACFISFVCLFILHSSVNAQLKLPGTDQNYACKTGRTIGLTEIEVNWNAPGVKGRAGKIWGTDIAHYGFKVLGFGSDMESPWRAGADENTTISFSTDVTINGKKLAAGKYGFMIALYPDSCTLIFNKNHEAWGSYFYNSTLDVLRVSTRQQKGINELTERLDFEFGNQKPESVELALEWEHWRIPFIIGIDVKQTTLVSINTQMSGALGFDPPSLEAAARWSLQNETNYEQALHWINMATSPDFGGVKTFGALSTKAGLLEKTGKKTDADAIMKTAIENATANELHGYGRSLIAQKKVNEAMHVFEMNFKKHKGAWPTQVGMMRGYSAKGDLKKALEHAKLAIATAPDPASKTAMEQARDKLANGEAL